MLLMLFILQKDSRARSELSPGEPVFCHATLQKAQTSPMWQNAAVNELEDGDVQAHRDGNVPHKLCYCLHFLYLL